jgi:DNA-binding response OmpR family regulator
VRGPVRSAIRWRRCFTTSSSTSSGRDNYRGGLRFFFRGAGRRNARKYSALLIEDNVQFITAVKMLLKLEGYEPRVASNREEIVAALRNSPLPDVILLDVNLPGADGFDILARIRQHPALRTIPVVMLTAQTNRKDVLRGLSGGANGYITKPFEHDVLMKSLRAVLGLTE